MRYADFTAAIAAVRDAAHSTGQLTVDGRDAVDALVRVFAADELGLPVAVTNPLVPVPAAPTAPAGSWLIVVTSGTTGRPRPVVRTAESWTASFAPFTELTGLTPTTGSCSPARCTRRCTCSPPCTPWRSAPR